MIRSQTPYIETRRKRKRLKLAKYKEAKRKRYATNRDTELYKDRSERRRKSSNNTASERERKVYTRATPRLRSQYKKLLRRKQRKYNRKLNNVKECTMCKEVKAISDFDLLHNKDKSSTLRRPYCYVCRKKANAEAYRKRIDNGNN